MIQLPIRPNVYRALVSLKSINYRVVLNELRNKEILSSFALRRTLWEKLFEI